MFDVVIKNGTVIDGTGKQQFRGDVGVKDGVIYEMGNLADAPAKVVIDATGRFVVPGFIDSGNHSDTHWTLFTDPSQESLIRQGITTIIGGNCGSSLAPLINKESIRSIQKWVPMDRVNIDWQTMGEFLTWMEKRSIGVNFATLVGHATLRRAFTHDESRSLTKEEQGSIEKAIEESMQEGALGLSSGLVYAHGRAGDDEEIYALVRKVQSFSGIYTTHLRNEMSLFHDAVRETLEIAEKTNIKTHISHLKVLGHFYWSVFDEVLKEIELGVQTGLDVTFGVFPYTATGSVLYTLLPEWASRGGKSLMLARLRDPNARRDIIEDLRRKQLNYSKMSVSFSGGVYNTLEKMAERQGVDPEEVILNLLLAKDGRVIVFMDLISEENIRSALRSPCSLIATDGAGYSLKHKNTGERVHPRSFGAFPRVLGKYVREEGLLTWEDAIFKMTELPARTFGLRERGALREGYFADVVVFDPESVCDKATFENPYQYSTGIESVLINGQLVLNNGTFLEGRFGRILKK